MEEQKEAASLYYKDELSPPDFLNEKFFENILREKENSSDLKVTNLKIMPASKAGDHFSSIIFKAIFDYSSQGKETTGWRLVVKTLPVKDTDKKDLRKDSPIFDREIEMYTKVLPAMKNILESIGDDEELAPSLIYHSRYPAILVFEDITMRGYAMDEVMFDFDNTVKITRKLAKFHAVSYHMADNCDNKHSHGIDLTQYKSLMNKSLMEKFKIFFDGFQYLAKEMANWEGYEEMTEKIAKLDETFPDKLIKSFASIPNFPVLCHADFHPKNLMFIKNGDSIEKTMFLDFQMALWGSPAIDLLYVMYAIADGEARKRRHEIVKIYHKALSENLNRLGCLKEPPPLLDLHVDMLHRGAIDILWIVCFLPFFALETGTLDANTFTNPSPAFLAKIRKTMYTNDKVVEMLKVNLTKFSNMGIL